MADTQADADYAALCASCARICDASRFEQLRSATGIYLQTTSKLFRTAVLQGCPICSLLAKAAAIQDPKGTTYLSRFRTRNTTGEDEDLRIHLRLRIGFDPYQHQAHLPRRDVLKMIGEALEVSANEPQEAGPDVLFHAAAERDDPAAAHVLTRPIQRAVASAESFTVARRWIHECLSEHLACPQPIASFAPLRLLELLSDTQHTVRLSTDHAPSVNYAALSYCWGGEQVFALNKDNLGNMKSGIDICKLPQLLRDAMHAARQLQLRFIWIDALCIVQDSVEDVTQEISTMHQVYQGAYVTLLAASASSCHQPILHDRPAAWISTPSKGTPAVKAAKILFPCSDGREGTILLQPFSMYSWMREPLHQRGWALQERVLSSRCLIFNSWQLEWCCKQRHDGNGGRPEVIYWPPLKQLAVRSTLNSSGFFPLIKQSPAATHQEWLQLVQDFSFRDMSLAQDRLRALSGLATLFADALQDEYVAGLWRSHLQSGLAWKRALRGHSRLRIRRSHYIAPSWSWASASAGAHWLDGDISLDSTRQTAILRVFTEPLVHGSQFGAVTYGWLHIRALVKEISWRDLWTFSSQAACGTAEIEAGSGVELYLDEFQKRISARNNRQYESKLLQIVHHSSTDASLQPLWLICVPLVDRAALVVVRFSDTRLRRVGLLRFSGDSFIEQARVFWSGCCKDELIIY